MSCTMPDHANVRVAASCVPQRGHFRALNGDSDPTPITLTAPREIDLAPAPSGLLLPQHLLKVSELEI